LTERTRPGTAAPTNRGANAIKPPKDTAEEEKKGKPTTISNVPKERPQTAKPAKDKEEEKKTVQTKPTTVAPGKKPTTTNTKDEGDADDPIAKSLAERVKAGSITA
jgi:hypothetical protein